ncbi:unnamed protein product [Mytilus edulis]|uniref:Core-binding (CB) domain-containing protein n=1 Tax=Mytilus edulis TaxID=6550 RepID=A0A8S3T018_MYTED|nr:unnamed protein product [Mytilus edulis]
MSSVRKGAKRHGGIGWKYYDEQYRLKKAREPSGSWGKLDSEYWMWYMQSASVQPEGQAANQASNSRALYTNQTATTSRCYSFNFDVRKVQKVSTIGGGYTRNSPSGVHRPDLQGEIDRLIVSAVAPNTSKVYQQALRSFKEFRTLFQFEDLWPIPLHHITNYIAYMSFTGTAASTVKSYISGLSFSIRRTPELSSYTHWGNDLGEIKTGVLRNRLKHYLKKVTELLLNTTLVWSQILPRLTWRYSADTDAMDRSRQRINSSLASYIIRQGGHYIRYPDISPNSTFICQDGVHLTDIGNYIFLNTIQGALEAFLVYSPHTFPECKS